ncbi:hypothetical protein J5751_02570 [bacterium]|nr:hypothetical protein [bacterium]
MVSKADKVSPQVFIVLDSKVGEVYHPSNIKSVQLASVFSGSLIAFIVATPPTFSTVINPFFHQFTISKFALPVEFLKQRNEDQLLRCETFAKRKFSP